MRVYNKFSLHVCLQQLSPKYLFNLKKEFITFLLYDRSPDFSPQEKGEPTENDVMKEFGFLTTENDDEIGDDEVDGGDQQRTSRPIKVGLIFYNYFMLQLILVVMRSPQVAFHFHKVFYNFMLVCV